MQQSRVMTKVRLYNHYVDVTILLKSTIVSGESFTELKTYAVFTVF